MQGFVGAVLDDDAGEDWEQTFGAGKDMLVVVGRGEAAEGSAGGRNDRATEGRQHCRGVGSCGSRKLES